MLDFKDFLVFLLSLVAVKCEDNVIQPFIPCKQNDAACIKDSYQEVYNKIMYGSPSAGIPSLQRNHLPVISGVVKDLNYNFTDTTTVGFEYCDVTRFNMDLKKSRFAMEIECESLTKAGEFYLKGDLLGTKVNEVGHFKLFTGKANFEIETEIRKITEENGKCYYELDLDNCYKFVREDGKMKIKVRSYRDKYNFIDCFVKSRWSEVSELFKKPMVDADIKSIVLNINKLLKHSGVDYTFEK